MYTCFEKKLKEQSLTFFLCTVFMVYTGGKLIIFYKGILIEYKFYGKR